ncbi:hypothetical protein ACFQ05_02420 [Amycolatopsis umgeniensis]|uniref:Uncharacterized membrane protein (UPF0136 family) n=1 Tax=Amycolatopsis umgeniensis TaxID=336628 RepID=A0A841B0W2_9PSEU|nr:hypothetical protein [Amycolatopsis umgeniensis]MBB5852114.1 uncharacterized membrane protein (UPF0136 family) [Amycolatopsis umgeniensis]
MPVETEDDATRAPRSDYFRASDLGAVLAGVVSGAVGAYAYYSDVLRPLAHSFTIWIVLVVAVTAGAPRRRAVIRATGALIAAVLAFYWGKALFYGIKYEGMPYQIDVSTTTLWCALAIAGGLLAGFLLNTIGRTDIRGTVATAAVIGLLIADVVRQSGRSGIGVLLLATAVAIGFVGFRGIRSVRQGIQVTACAIPLGGLGFVVVSAPDIIEEVLIRLEH